ncbi:MAG: GntR family transcriptional regulator [Acholeplasmataceae bacterium]
MKVDLMSKEPFYLQIREHIRKNIESGVWPEGMMIPTEKELSETYKVSRVTIRKAISALVDQNYLTRRAGFGTMVYQNKRSLSNFTLVRSFTKEMNEMGIATSTLDIHLKKIKADQVLASIFKIKEGDYLYRLERVRGSSMPILYSDTYLRPIMKMPKDIAPLKESLYRFLGNQNIYFTDFEEFVSAVSGTKEIKAKLRITDQIPLLKRVRFAYDEKGTLIEYTETYYNSLLYEYRTEIRYRE